MISESPWDGRIPLILKTLFGSYALVGGGITLVGWLARIPALTDWDGDGIAMFANAALMAAGGGLALLLQDWGKTAVLVSRAFSLAVALIGSATLFQHLSGIDLGIDQLLASDPWGSRAATAPGRPGPPASTSFTLLGIALFLRTCGFRPRGLVPAFGILSAAIAALSLLGYLFGADPLYAVSRFTGIALQTSTMTLALALGLIAGIPERQPMRALMENSAAGALTRRALPFIIGLPTLLGWLRLQGQDAGLFDVSMGTALLIVILIFLLCALLWWCVAIVSDREHRLRLKEESLMREIAERKRTEEALLNHEAMLRSITDHCADVIFIKDRDSRTIFFNPAGLRLAGLDQDQIIGRTDEEIYPQYPEQAAAFMAADRRVMESGAPETIEEEAQTADGSRFVLLTTKTPRLDADGKVIGVIGISRDITERKRAEEELRSAAERAQQALRAKDDFLASLSHELRTPLTPALLTAAALEDDPDLPSDFREQLTIIRRNIQLEARLIDDLLDLTRVSRGKLSIHPELTDAHEVIKHALETISQDVHDKRLVLRVELEAVQSHVRADPPRLQQVLWNLLKNAVKFTAPGGSVTIKTFNSNSGRVAVRVEDTGIGIAPTELERIFLAFNQGDLGSRHQFGGLGLGLAISKAIIDAHSGELRAESAGPGQGAAFTIEIEAAPAPKVVNETHRRPPSQPLPPPLRLLVVEDHQPTLGAMSHLLERDGHLVFRASNVQEALTQAATNACDLMISDLGLPDGDGYDLMSKIRERYGWPGVALSGYGMDTDIQKSSAAGFSAHLIKPVEIAQLREVIGSVLANGVAPPPTAKSQPL